LVGNTLAEAVENDDGDADDFFAVGFGLEGRSEKIGVVVMSRGGGGGTAAVKKEGAGGEKNGDDQSQSERDNNDGGGSVKAGHT